MPYTAPITFGPPEVAWPAVADHAGVAGDPLAGVSQTRMATADR